VTQEKVKAELDLTIGAPSRPTTKFTLYFWITTGPRANALCCSVLSLDYPDRGAHDATCRARAIFTVLAVLAAVTATAAETRQEGAKQLALLEPLAEKYCYKCHDDVVTEGELDLAALLAPDRPAAPSYAILEKILESVASGEMPPQKAKAQPSAAERAAMVNAVHGHVARLQRETRGDPGAVVIPRLTKSEYRNVIRDLTGGIVRTGGEFLPNEGGAGEGFANVGEAQGMGVAQFERYLEAAKGALRHLRATPTTGLEWRPMPADAVNDPGEARADAVYDIVQWYFRQQQHWGAEHREHLQSKLGFSHAAYLEAAWRYRWRAELGFADADIGAVGRAYEVPLGPVSLEKWWKILNDADPKSPFAAWAATWRDLPAASATSPAEIRRRCISIVAGAGQTQLDDSGDFAPPYEVSFLETKEEVLRAATGDQRWPFRIEVGDAKDLFIVITDAGDGGGEFALWRRGRFVFRDGSTRPWQEVTSIIGANSGRVFPWGLDGANTPRLAPDEVGMRSPGTLKFSVPAGAVTFEVEAALDQHLTKVASIQALVLKQKPASQSFVPGRKVFGGRARQVTDPAVRATRDRDRFLRLRNVAEANETKLGLNAERNVLANWTHSPVEFIGGPWPEHAADKLEPRAPYHFTAVELRRNVTPAALRELSALEDRLASLVQKPHQEISALARSHGVERPREGVAPPADVIAAWPAEAQARATSLRREIEAAEQLLEASVATALRDFARRAWRRPLTDAEAGALVAHYRATRRGGASFDAAVKAPLLIVLTSPHFLYRTPPAAVAETDATPARTVPLSGRELASRLSFFLWASLPDEELQQLGESGALRDPAVLRAQTRRLLRDARAGSLATDFAAQLWGFADFAQFTNPDPKRFPEFTPALRQAMIDEVTTFLSDLFQHDRPLTALLDANYTYANAELAKHYGLPANSPSTTRIALPAEQRGGLATMGLFLTKASLPLRTSPVQRGVWLMEQMLGRHLPNPPANVPQLSPDEKNPAGENIRQQLERHRADASCASCHNKIDPLGIALENFDPIGRWRTSDRDGTALATVATTHDGVELSGAAGLRRYLASRQDEFFRHFTRKLLGYALGRSVLPGDQSLLDEMRSGITTSSGTFSMLAEAIVTSPQFTQRRPSPHQTVTAHP
jgi:hypothetical protein